MPEPDWDAPLTLTMRRGDAAAVVQGIGYGNNLADEAHRGAKDIDRALKAHPETKEPRYSHRQIREALTSAAAIDAAVRTMTHALPGRPGTREVVEAAIDAAFTQPQYPDCETREAVPLEAVEAAYQAEREIFGRASERDGLARVLAAALPALEAAWTERLVKSDREALAFCNACGYMDDPDQSSCANCGGQMQKLPIADLASFLEAAWRKRLEEEFDKRIAAIDAKSNEYDGLPVGLVEEAFEAALKEVAG